MALLVTGGGGFVGLNLVEAPLERAEEVILFDAGALAAAARGAYKKTPGWGRGKTGEGWNPAWRKLTASC